MTASETKRTPTVLARGSLCALLLVSMLLVCGTAGDSPLNGAAADPDEVRFVTLSAEEIGKRINKHWKPVERSQIERSIARAAKPRKGPRTLQVRRATYSATFDGRQLRAGTVDLEIHRVGRSGKWLDLGECNLALSSLTANQRDVVWGSTPNGQVVAEIEPGQTRLNGHWTMPGTRQDQVTRFDLTLIPATAASLKIRAPARWQIDFAAGEFAGKTVATKPGWTDWVIDVSGRQTVSLVAWPRLDSAKVSPRVLVNGDLRYVIHESALRMEYRAKLHVLNSPIRAVEFRVPKSVRIYRVDYAETTPLNFERGGAGDENLVTVRLPDRLLGKSRWITLHGIAPIETDRLWRLPAVTVLNGVHASGEVHLRIGRPLRLGRLTTRGLRQSTPLTVEPSYEEVSFHQDRADARLGIFVGRLSPKLKCRAVTQLDAQTERCTLTEELECTATQGPVFGVRLQTYRNWTITGISAVEEAGVNGRALNWTEIRAANRARVLNVVFARPLDTGQSIRLRLIGHSRDVTNRRRIRLPVLFPMDADRMHSTIVLRHAGGFRPMLREGGTYRALSEAAAGMLLQPGVGPPWGDARLPMVVQSDARRPRGVLDLRGRSETFDVQAWTICSVANGTLRERFWIALSTDGRAPTEALVSLSHPGPALTWRLADNPSRVLPATRIRPTGYSRRELPATGELWRIDLPGDHAPRLRLTAERTRRLTAQTKPAVPFAPQSRRFEGVLELREAKPQPVQSRALFPVRDTSGTLAKRPKDAPPVLESSRYWRYQTLDAALSLERSPAADASELATVKSVDVWTVLSPLADGRDRQRAVYRFKKQPTPGWMVWDVPQGLRIDRVTVNGISVNNSVVDGRLRIGSLPAEQSNVVVVDFSFVSNRTGWHSRQTILLLKSAQPIRNARWHLVMPKHMHPVPGAATTAPLPAVASADWPVRFFGPLARSRRSSGRRSETDQAAVAANRSDISIPDGWTVYHTTLPELPAEIRLELTNRRFARRLAWIGLLFCLVLGWSIRRWKLSARASLTAWWMCGLLAIALVVPASYAEFAGACVVGSLMAILTPRRLIRRETVSEASLLGIPMGSTASFPRVANSVSLVLLAAVVLLARAVTADEPSQPRRDAKGGPPVIDENTILVPKDGSFKNGRQLVWVHRALQDALKAAAVEADASPAYVIRRATYDLKTVDSDSANLMALFEVIRSTGQSGVTVRLPISHAHLCGRNACRVNGKPQFVRRDPDGAGFLVDLPNSNSARTFRIELCLRAVLEGTGPSRGLQVGIPAVPASRLYVESPAGGRRVDTSAMSNVVEDDVWFSHRMRGDFGRRTRLVLPWMSPEAADSMRATIDADVRGVVSLTPALSTYSYRVRYSGVDQAVSQVRWQIPDDWSILSITVGGPATSPGRLRYREHERDGPRREVLVSLPSPQTQPFELNASFVVPNAGRSPLVRIDVPRLHGSPSRERARGTIVRETAHAIGLIVPAEFELKLAPSRSAALKPISDGDRAAFRASFPGKRAPQFAFQVTDASTLRGRLTQALPARDVESRQAFLFERGRMRTRYSARVAVASAAVNTHELAVPPALQIDSVQVVENGAPRLARWVRSGGRITLYLAEKSLGPQSVSIEGRMRVPASRKVALHLFRFQNARSDSLRIELFRDPDVGIGVVESGDAISLEDVRTAETNFGWFVAAWRAGAMKPPTVRIAERKESLKVERLTRIGQQSDEGDWVLHFTLRLRDKLPASGVRLTIPPGLPAKLRDVENRWKVDTHRQPDGSEIWMLHGGRRSKPDDVEIVARMSPSDAETWQVPAPWIESATLVGDYLAITSTKLPVRRTSPAERVAPAKRPKWIADRLERRHELFRNAGDSWRFAAQSDGKAAGRLAVPLVESVIWNLEDRPVRGFTDFYIESADRRALTVRLPSTLVLVTVEMNGRPVELRPTNAGLLLVPLNDAPAQHLRIVWRRARSRKLPAVAVQRFDLPQPVDVDAGRHLVRMVTSGTRRASGFKGATALPSARFQIERIRTLIAFANSTKEPNAATASAFQTANRAFQRLSAESRDLKLTELENDLRELRSRMKNRPAAEIAASPPAAGNVVWHGELNSKTGEGGFQHRVVDRRLARGVLALLVFAVTLPMSLLVFRLELGNLLARWEPLAWAALGTVWVLFLTPWLLGAAFLLVAVFKAAARFIQLRRRNVTRVYDQKT